MKAVILAAGLCTRIRTVTSLPKCLLDFNGQAIIDYQLASLCAAGINHIAIVIGYQGDKIVEHVTQSNPALLDDITFIQNPRYAITNNIYSLWLARNFIDSSSVLCLNADVLYHPAVIVPAVNNTADISMIVDDELREETMKVIVRNGSVIEMRKGIPPERASGTYIGITAFSASIMPSLMREVESLITTGHEREFFNVAVQHLISRGTKVRPTSTALLPWAEVDDRADYEFARQYDWSTMYDTLEPTLAGSSLLSATPRVEVFKRENA